MILPGKQFVVKIENGNYRIIATDFIVGGIFITKRRRPDKSTSLGLVLRRSPQFCICHIELVYAIERIFCCQNVAKIIFPSNSYKEKAPKKNLGSLEFTVILLITQ